MLIFWGRKVTRKTLGYVADFCPICRDHRPFQLQAVRSTGHVYYISLAGGQLVGYQRNCQECGTPFNANAAAYASVSKELLPLGELKQQTFPGLDAATKDRLELEARIKAGSAKLQPSERNALIKAPFLFLSPKVEKRFASTHVDGGVGLALAAVIPLLFIGEILGKQFRMNSPELALGWALLIGAGLVIWQVAESGPRFMRREILPVLAKALKPLEPTREEIESVLGELRGVKQKIGKKVRVPELLERLSGTPT